MAERQRNDADGRNDPGAEEVVIAAGEAPLSVDAADISDADLRSSFKRLIHLYNLAHDIYAVTDPGRVFDAVLEAVSKLLNVERAFIAVVENGRLEPRAAHHIDLQGEPSDWPVSTTMLRRVLAEGVSLLATDAFHDAQYGKAPSVDLHSIRSVICCPLGVRQEPQGLIYVDNRLLAGAFARADLEYLHALSHYAFLAVENAQARRRIAAEKELAEARLAALGEEIASDQQIVATSRKMVDLYGTAKKAARKDVPVLLSGETGTGKEVFARLIHASSPRSDGPFVAVHTSALPHTLVESELFGHEKGAFTGADERRIGRFELAQGGTLFLDEIQDIPPQVQPKLLRVLEERRFERLGSNEPIEADIRVVCACSRDPARAVEEGVLRAELYYRLAGVTIEIPPLRDRREDVVPLLLHFLTRCGSDKTFDDRTLARLASYDWPGNVRELKQCVEALDALVEEPTIRESDLPDRMRPAPGEAVGGRTLQPLPEAVARLEEAHIRRALELADGKNEEAIRLLGISRATFFKRKKKYGL